MSGNRFGSCDLRDRNEVSSLCLQPLLDRPIISRPDDKVRPEDLPLPTVFCCEIEIVSNMFDRVCLAGQSVAPARELPGIKRITQIKGQQFARWRNALS